MWFIFARGLLPLLLLTLASSAEEDPPIGNTLDFIKNISLQVGQVSEITQNLEYMIDGLQQNQRYLETEIENLKDISSTIIKKLDQLLGSNEGGSSPTKESLEKVERKYENLNEKVNAIGEIIPTLNYAFKQELLTPNNASVVFSVSEILPRDCLEVFQRISSVSGVYKIYPDRNLWYSREVMCNEGYTVILKRQKTLKTHFNRTWVEYMQGFGSPEGEHYIGNELLHLLTNGRNQELSIKIKSEYDHEGSYNYSMFRVGNADTNYKLSVMGFSGRGSDAFSQHNGYMFTTLDLDNDHYDRNTASMDKSGKGGGWWYGGWIGLRGTYPDRAMLSNRAHLNELTMMIKTN